MGRNEYHVTPDPKGGWKIDKAGPDDVIARFDRKEDAVGYARELCRVEKAELVIHDQHGRIQEKDSYGHDPVRTKG